MLEPHHHTVLVTAIVVAAIAALIDARKGVIPDWITLPVLVGAPVLHVLRYSLAKEPLEPSLYEGAFAIGGAALCGVVPLLLFRQGAIGGGDVKLFLALGALLQPLNGFEAQMYAFFAAAVLAPAVLLYEGKLLLTIRNAATIAANLFLPRARQRAVDGAALTWFRLGPAVFIGVLLTAYLHW